MIAAAPVTQHELPGVEATQGRVGNTPTGDKSAYYMERSAHALIECVHIQLSVTVDKTVWYYSRNIPISKA